ncbi:DUF5684 domain-containing protein [Eubacteriales bacterium KG127]
MMDYTSNLATNEGIFAALFGGTVWIIGLAIYIVTVIGLWKVFTKAGIPGWLSLIPIVNLFMIVKIATGNALIAIGYFIPIVNIIVPFYVNYQLAKAYGKGIGFFLGLTFLAPIFIIILGFDDSQYIGPGGEPTPSDYVIRER